jgi:Protein of unknown function (DUF2933)
MIENEKTVAVAGYFVTVFAAQSPTITIVGAHLFMHHGHGGHGGHGGNAGQDQANRNRSTP